MSQIQGYVLSCKWCGSLFAMCKSCYRGHCYCSESCRGHGYNRARQQARERHEKSLEAKLDHRDRMKRYRKNQLEKTVTDKGSMFLAKHLDFASSKHLDLAKLPKNGLCAACGRRVWDQLGV